MFQFLVTLKALQLTVLDRIERDDKGATAVEYGLMVSLIAVVIIVAVTALGGNLKSMFTTVGGKINTTAVS